MRACTGDTRYCCEYKALAALCSLFPRCHGWARPRARARGAGYDAHWRDPLAGMQLAGATYHWICAQAQALAAEVCQGRCLLILEVRVASVVGRVAVQMRPELGACGAGHVPYGQQGPGRQGVNLAICFPSVSPGRLPSGVPRRVRGGVLPGPAAAAPRVAARC